MNIRFSKSASLQEFFSHFVLMMEKQCRNGIPRNGFSVWLQL